MLPVVSPDYDSTAKSILWTSIALLPVSLLPVALSMAGSLYLAAALLMGAIFFSTAISLYRHRDARQARGVLLASVVYLPVLYAALIFGPR
jgi:protoheme IX farnesyltransferase